MCAALPGSGEVAGYQVRRSGMSLVCHSFLSLGHELRHHADLDVHSINLAEPRRTIVENLRHSSRIAKLLDASDARRSHGRRGNAGRGYRLRTQRCQQERQTSHTATAELAKIFKLPSRHTYSNLDIFTAIHPSIHPSTHPFRSLFIHPSTPSRPKTGIEERKIEPPAPARRSICTK